MSREYEDAKREIIYQLRLMQSQVLLFKKITDNIKKEDIERLKSRAERNLEEIRNNGNGIIS
jgi:hypothetical protein